MAPLKVYRCAHCMMRFVVVVTKKGEYLPIEIKEKEEVDDSVVFDHTKHTSHLLNCVPRRMDWNDVRKKFINLNNFEMDLALNRKSLLK